MPTIRAKNERYPHREQYHMVQPETRNSGQSAYSEGTGSALSQFYERHMARAYGSSSSIVNSHTTFSTTEGDVTASFTSTNSSWGPLSSETNHFCATCDTGSTPRGPRRCDFGIPGTRQHRLLLLDSRGSLLSPYDDVPLYHRRGLVAERLLHCVCKTPRDTWAKYEVADLESFRPLRLAKGSTNGAHFAENLGWNVSMLPQTWAEPTLPNVSYGGLPYKGGHMEVLDIGSTRSATGEVYTLKPLGGLLVLDPESSTISWKIIGVASDSDMAMHLNDIRDVDEGLPGLLEAIGEWLSSTANGAGGILKPCQVTKAVSAVNARKLIHEAHGWFKHQRKVALLSAPPPPPTTPSKFFSLWQEYVQHEDGDLAIPLSDPSRGSFARYERAWVECDIDTSPASDPKHLPASAPVTPAGNLRREEKGSSAKRSKSVPPAEAPSKKPHRRTPRSQAKSVPNIYFSSPAELFHGSGLLKDNGLSFAEAKQEHLKQQAELRLEQRGATLNRTEPSPKRNQLQQVTRPELRVQPQVWKEPTRQSQAQQEPLHQRNEKETQRQRWARCARSESLRRWHSWQDTSQLLNSWQEHGKGKQVKASALAHRRATSAHVEELEERFEEFELDTYIPQQNRRRSLDFTPVRHRPKLRQEHSTEENNGDSAWRRSKTLPFKGSPAAVHEKGAMRHATVDTADVEQTRRRHNRSAGATSSDVPTIILPEWMTRVAACTDATSRGEKQNHHQPLDELSSGAQGSLDIPRSQLWAKQVAKSTATLERARTFVMDECGSGYEQHCNLEASPRPRRNTGEIKSLTPDKVPKCDKEQCTTRKHPGAGRSFVPVTRVSNFRNTFPVKPHTKFRNRRWSADDMWHPHETSDSMQCFDPLSNASLAMLKGTKVATKFKRLMFSNRGPRAPQMSR